MEGDECSFGHVKFEMPVRQTTGAVEWVVGNLDLAFRGKVKSGDN